MKIIGFLKTYQDDDKNLLEKSLNSLKKICTDIAVCYDTNGKENGTLEIINRFTKHVITLPDDFKNELSHKQKLLEYVHENIGRSGWILHLDSDEILDKTAIEGVKKLCEFGDMFEFDSFAFHLINLWGSNAWLRTDNQFNDLWKTILWKNSPDLKFDTSEGLHRPQQPMNLRMTLPTKIQIIHFGFSSFDSIAKKYVTYEKNGQSGYALSRLRPDGNSQLVPMDLNLYDFEVKGCPPPKITSAEWLKLCQKLR